MKYKSLPLIVTFIVIFVSGTPLTISDLLYVLVFLALIFLAVMNKSVINNLHILLIFFTCLVFFIQTLKFNYFAFSYFGQLVKMGIGIMLVSYLRSSFTYFYRRCLYYIATFSLIIFVLNLSFPSIVSSLSFPVTESDLFKRYSLFGLYTIIEGSSYRNAGLFWEPGAFGGYLVLALLFNTIENKKLFNKEFIILLLATLSTFSTAAYLALLFLFAVALLIRNSSTILVGIVTIMPLIFYSFFNFDFLYDKLSLQYEVATQVYRYSGNSQRFIILIKDYYDIQGHFFFGRGWDDTTRFSEDDLIRIRTVGITDILVKNGIFFFVLLMAIFFKSASNYLRNYGFDGLLILFFFSSTLLMPLTAQTYLNYPLFWGILSFGLYIKLIPQK